MTTTQSRVQFNISAKDQTAAAFASVRRSLDGFNRTASQVKALFAGALGGAGLAKGIRELISISAETEPVRQAFDRLKAAMTGFAREVGDNGLNSALVYFADRIGAMVYGTDGLAKSIGALLGGGVRLLASVFEGVGRAIAFAYDNMEILGRYMAILGLAAFGQRVIGAASAFYYFAKTVRATGLIMGVFSAISRANLVIFLALAAGVAYATDSLDDLRAGMDLVWKKATEIFPQIGQMGGAAMEALGFDLSALSDDLANTYRFMDKLPAVTTGAAGAVATLGRTASETAGKVKGDLVPSMKDLGDTAASTTQEVGQMFQNSFTSAFSSVVDGSATAKAAFTDMTQSMLKDVINFFGNRAVMMLINMLGNALAGGGGGAASGLGSLNFGGPRAGGGPVAAGKSYLVGERGPELFTPGRSGGITPNGAGGGTVVNIINQGGGEVQQRRSRDGQGREVLDVVVGIVRQEQARGAKKMLGGGFGLTPALTQR